MPTPTTTPVTHIFDASMLEEIEMNLRTAPADLVARSEVGPVVDAVKQVRTEANQLAMLGHLTPQGITDHLRQSKVLAAARDVLIRAEAKTMTTRQNLETAKAEIEAGRRFRNPQTGNFETKPTLSNELPDVLRRQEIRQRFLSKSDAERRDLLTTALKADDRAFLDTIEETSTISMPTLNEADRRFRAEVFWKRADWSAAYSEQSQVVFFAERIIEKTRRALGMVKS